MDNLNVFLEHKDDWDDVDADILSYRDESTKENLEEESNLFAAVRNEVKYVYAIWDEDYEKATEFAQEVVTAYTGGVRLKGLRALWNYFAGSSALLVAEKFNKSNYKAISETHFIKAAAAAKTVGWLRSLANTQNATIEDTENLVDELLDSNIERLDLLFSQKNYTNQHTFEIEIADILKRLGINKAKTFEGAVSDIGKLLGFISENPSGDAEPDPYWQVDDKLCLIFEAKSDAKVSTPVSVRYATQIASQSVTWVKENLELSENATIIPVLVTPQIKIEESAVIHAKECRYWEINLFREWVVQDVIPIIRKLRSKYPGPSDMMWRAETADIISAANLSPSSIVDSLRKFLKDLPS